LGSNDRAQLARPYPVKSPFVAIIDDDEALCSSLADVILFMGPSNDNTS